MKKLALNQGAQTKVSRRSVAKGAAWATPGLVIASAAPAFAVSGAPPSVTVNSACKYPGASGGGGGLVCTPPVTDKEYRFEGTVCNNDTENIYVYTITFTDLVGANLTLNHAQPPLPFLVAPGCQTVIFRAIASNSANATFTVNMNVDWGHTLPVGSDTDHPPVVVPIQVDGSNPCTIC